MKYERRVAFRREVDPIEISEVMSLTKRKCIADFGALVQASSSGFLILIQRKHIVEKELKANLDLSGLVGDQIILVLPQMNLEISGRITRTKYLGKKGFEIAVDYSDDAPEYWRECLVDLLPRPGEFSDKEE